MRATFDRRVRRRRNLGRVWYLRGSLHGLLAVSREL